ncbi:MAG: site-specific DNA-methyltransferase [Proteobacteria bacterium]|nr:site-specific DNA-methyltransferase [Pseudomonadota bacterium]
MGISEKRRAPRNRTLTLGEGENAQLSPRLLEIIEKRPFTMDEIHNRTLHADLLAVLPLLPAEFADLIIIDPPYNLSKDFNGMKFKAASDAGYLEYLRSWFPQVCRLLKPTGSLYLCGDWKSTASLQQVMSEHLYILNRISWQREKGRGALKNWKNGMEDIWFGVKDPKNYYFDVDAVKVKRKVIAPYREHGQPKDWEETEDGNFRLTYPSNFWDDITIPYWSMPENTDHPTQKSEKLLAKLILASCPHGGLVFDPFLGSGTTSVTAKKLGRHFFGVEINLEYCLLTEKRLLRAENDKSIQGYSDGVFWERNSLQAQQKAKIKRSQPKQSLVLPLKEMEFEGI